MKQKYFTACSSAECFWDAPEDVQEEEETADNLEETVDCLAFLKQLQDEQKLLADEEVATSKEAAADAQPADSFEAGFSNIPDSDQLRQLMEKPASLEPFRSECSRSPKNPEKDNLLPTTLRAALAMRDQGDLFNHLFRLNLKLRSTKGGIDTGLIQNAHSCRRASTNLNWHQFPSWCECFIRRLHFVEVL